MKTLKQLPFSFVVDELQEIRPIIKQMFGFTHIYLDEKLLCSLRSTTNRPATNGIWLYTTVEDLESLRKEFPNLPKHCLWRSKRNAWVILESKLEGFEEYAFKACELMLRGDQRIGRLSRGKNVLSKQPLRRRRDTEDVQREIFQ